MSKTVYTAEAIRERQKIYYEEYMSDEKVIPIANELVNLILEKIEFFIQSDFKATELSLQWDSLFHTLNESITLLPEKRHKVYFMVIELLQELGFTVEVKGLILSETNEFTVSWKETLNTQSSDDEQSSNDIKTEV